MYGALSLDISSPGGIGLYHEDPNNQRFPRFPRYVALPPLASLLRLAAPNPKAQTIARQPSHIRLFSL